MMALSKLLSDVRGLITDADHMQILQDGSAENCAILCSKVYNIVRAISAPRREAIIDFFTRYDTAKCYEEKVLIKVCKQLKREGF